MVSKLLFKGDKKQSKKAKSSSKVLKHSPSTLTTDTIKEDEVWVSASEVSHITGPAVFTILNDEDIVCFAAAADGKIYTSTNLASSTNGTSKGSVHSTEPVNIQQVFVVTQADFEEESKIKANTSIKKAAFKTSSGTYLTAKKSGELIAKATAVGPEQTFKLELLSDGNWIVSSIWDDYITIVKDSDNLSGYEAKTESVPKLEAKRFTIRVQNKHLKVASSSRATSDRYISSAELESRVGSPLTRDQIKLLKKAYKNGKLNEAVLDVKQKLKTDTMC